MPYKQSALLDAKSNEELMQIIIEKTPFHHFCPFDGSCAFRQISGLPLDELTRLLRQATRENYLSIINFGCVHDV